MEIQDEIWRKWRNTYYSVSNQGRVRNDKFNRIINGRKQLGGYIQVALREDDGVKWRLVHRMVGELFVPNRMEGTEINHINEDKTDNRAANLEWVTHEYNINYGNHNQRMVETKAKKRGAPRKIRQMPMDIFDDSTIRVWRSAYEIQKELGFCSACILWCCNGISKSAYGYRWRYAIPEKKREQFNRGNEKRRMKKTKTTE